MLSACPPDPLLSLLSLVTTTFLSFFAYIIFLMSTGFFPNA